MSEKNGKFGKKQKVLLIALVVVVIGGGTGLISYNKKVEAEKIELAEKKEKEDYQKLTLKVNNLVKKAYDTRNVKDIELAEATIKKLKEPDQKDPKAQIKKLHSFLDVIKKTDQLLATAEKSKKDSDIKAAQNSINGEKDAYVKRDKEAQQKRLDKLKQAIKEQKEKQAKEKAEKEKVQKTEEQNQQTVNEPKVKNVDNSTKESKKENDAQNEAPANDPSVPNPDPSPAPQPNAPADNDGGYTPAPQPDPTPTPTPNPTPEPTPAPQPDPTPEPTPDPKPTPDPTPIQQWVGWWNDGKELHSAGTFNSEAEALAAGKALYIQNGRVGSWGASSL